MNFSKYKKSIIACVLALGIGVGGGYYFFGNQPVTHQTTVKNKLNKQNLLQIHVIHMLSSGKKSGPAVVGLPHKFSKRIFLTVPSMLEKV